MNLALPGLPSLALYLAGTSLLIIRFRGDQPVPSLKGVWWCVGLAATLHAIVLLIVGGGQWNLGFFHMLSAAALVMTLLVMLGTAWRPMLNLGVVLFPIAAVAIGLQLTLGAEQSVWRDLNWQINVHAVLSVLAFAILCLAGAQALLILAQDGALRGQRGLGVLQNLPPLQRMEQLLFQLIALGFVMLTLALVSGVLFVEDMMAQHLMHKTVLSVTAWLVFGALLLGHWRAGWRGRTASLITLTGVAVLLLAYFGSKLVLELILERVG